MAAIKAMSRKPANPVTRPLARYACGGFFLALLAVLMSLTPRSLPAASDVRIVIDVSGSMRENDPANLRVPALKLLTELLPAGAQAGVWAFAQQAEPLIAPGTVDAKWKAAARSAATKIHSRGLFTNVEAALTAATEDWKTPANADDARHVVLLTDGVVDVSADAKESAASRARLLKEGLTRFQVVGAKVNTVALSDKADAELLATIAKGTDGWFEKVDSAETLQRVFLHLFEQAAPPDALPLNGNRFTVDTSVKELTLLVFHAADAAPLELTAPDGQRINQQTAPESVAWRHEQGYDMVTLSAPGAGEWRFNAAADPDNRALIVTDLALSLANTPTNVMPGEPLPVTAKLLEQGRPLNRPDFLALVKADAARIAADGASEPVDLRLDESTFAFSGKLLAEQEPGDYTLLVRINGGTFQRELQRRFKVSGPPFSFSIDPAQDDAGARVVHLTLTADASVVDPATFSGLLELTLPNTPPKVLEFPALDGNEITLELPAAAAGDYIFQPWVYAQSRAQRLLKLKPEPIAVSFADGTRPQPEVASLPPPSPAPLPTLNPLHAAAVFGVGNLGLGSTLGGIYFCLRRRGLPKKGLSV